MTNIAHAVENAIFALLNNRTYNEWLPEELNRNLPNVTATPEEIWSIANYVVYGGVIDSIKGRLS